MADIIRKKEKKNWFYSYNMIFEQPISEHAKIVYLYLCRCADSEGQAFPSYNTIAEKCSISRSTAIRAIKELKEAGLLSVEQRIEADGSLTSNLYTIYDEPQPAEVQEVHHPSVTQTLPLVSHRHYPSVTQTPEGLPNEGLPNINNNIADDCKKENTARTEESAADVVVKNTVKAQSHVAGNDCQKKEATSSKEDIAGKIESVIGQRIAKKILQSLEEKSLNRALEAYKVISKGYQIKNPAGFFVYLAREGIEPPRPAGGRRQSFNQFEQHDWDPELLKSLWEPIGL